MYQVRLQRGCPATSEPRICRIQLVPEIKPTLLSLRESRPLRAGGGGSSTFLSPSNPPTHSPRSPAHPKLSMAGTSRPEAPKSTDWQAGQSDLLPRLFTTFSHRKTSTHHCPKPRGLVRLPVSRCTGAPSIDQNPSTGRQVLAMYSELKWSS